MRHLIRRVGVWRKTQPLTVSVPGMLGMTLIVLLIHGLLGFSIAGSSLYVLPVWLAARLDGKRSGLIAVLLVTSVLTAIEVRVHPSTAPLAVVQGVVRLISFGIVMLVVARIEESIAAFRHLAFRDPLTGLLNRRGLTEFARSLLTVKEADSSVVVMIDCDGFKKINDVFGHHAGDLVLKVLSRILEEETRSTDLVVRMGGDEFALVLNHSSLEEAKLVLRRIEEVFERKVRDAGYACTLSVGIADSSGNVDLEASLRAADEAMYRAKSDKQTPLYLS